MKWMQWVILCPIFVLFGQGMAEDSESEKACLSHETCQGCWQKCVYYEPKVYYTKRQVEKPITVKKKACRPVQRYYEVEKVRYKPEKYTETIARTEKEYYEVDEVKIVTEWVTEKQVEQVPRYYWQRVCTDPECTTPCPQIQES